MLYIPVSYHDFLYNRFLNFLVICLQKPLVCLGAWLKVASCAAPVTVPLIGRYLLHPGLASKPVHDPLYLLTTAAVGLAASKMLRPS